VIGLFPDWLLVLSTALGICVFVTGRIRLAGILAAPALLHFAVVPAFLALVSGIPVILIFGVLLLALPVLVVRAGRAVLVLFVGKTATDHAIGEALGRALIRAFRRLGRRR